MTVNKAARNAQIEQERNAGATLDALAMKHSLSRTRVSQIIATRSRNRMKLAALAAAPLGERYR